MILWKKQIPIYLVEVDPANGHYLLGRLYIYAGEVELAKQHLEEAVKVNPGLKSEVEEILDLLIKWNLLLNISFYCSIIFL